MHEPADDERSPIPAGDERSTRPYAVALCTYNGARHIEAQLRSIFAAYPVCSELVVVDDASTDDTLEIVARTIADWPGRAVIERNAVNRGSLRSFERAVGLTAEPVVFLSDQDDLWHADKPARLLEAFAARPDLLLLHSDARIVDDKGRPLGYTLLRAIEASPDERETIHRGDAFDAFVRRNLATGATVALRRNLLDAALPFPEGWVHDEWLATIASAIGTVDFLDEALIDYRQHGANQIGARRLSFGAKATKSFQRMDDYYERQVRRSQALLHRLERLGPRVPPDRLVKVREKLDHLGVRAGLPPNRLARLPAVTGEWLSGGYRRYSTGFKSAVRDLLHRV